jgi:hypothetical protein
MGKTANKVNNNDSGATPKTQVARTKKAAPAKTAATAKPKAVTKAPKAPAAKTPTAASSVRKPVTKTKAVISAADIQLRAYFISEKRHREGIHGNSHQDWLEAERQLIAEQQSGTNAKRAAKASAA